MYRKKQKKNFLILFEFSVKDLRIKIHISFFIGFLAVFYFLGEEIGFYKSLILTLLFYFSLFLHELAHYLEGKRLGYQIEGFVFHIIGATMLLRREILNHKDEFLMAFAGPLMSLFLSFVFINIYFFSSIDILNYIAAFNFIFGLVSFVPVYPLDGGRIFRATLVNFFTRKTATYVAKTFSVFVALGLFIYSVKLSFDGKYFEFMKYYFLSFFLLMFLQREIVIFFKRDIKKLKRRFLT